MIELQGINKRFSERFEIENLSLICEKNKSTVFIGQSGSGKSSLIRFILGLVKIDSGKISVDSSAINDSTLETFRQQCGYVIQSGGLFPHLNAFQNIALAAQYHQWSLAKIGARVNDLANLCKMDPSLLKQYPTELSGGQRQRVSIMRALMLDPQYIFLDEPLSALDPLIRFELQQDLKSIFNTLKKTVIMVTHDIHEAHFIADKVVFIHEGKILQEGRFDDLIKQPNDPFITEFISAQRDSFANNGEKL